MSTFVTWFSLALSDSIIVQSIDESGTYFIKDSVKPGTFVAASAFSRFAAIYGLNEDIRFGQNCSKVERHKFGRITQGNWVCVPKIFY